MGAAVCGLVVFRCGSFVRPMGEATGFYADVSESYSQDGPGLAKKVHLTFSMRCCRKTQVNFWANAVVLGRT